MSKNKTADDIEAWLKEDGHLPDVMKDFHDQKDIFKAMHEILGEAPHAFIKSPSWVEGHCYVTDMFLTFMARRGYTLQRTRKRGKFRDLAADVQAQNKRRSEAFTAALNGSQPATAPASSKAPD